MFSTFYDAQSYWIYFDNSFWQYNPDKPAKYGILYKSINSAAFPCTYQSHAYCGKTEGRLNEFYISGAENYTQYLLTELSGYHTIRGRNITMDRLYNSFICS